MEPTLVTSHVMPDVFTACPAGDLPHGQANRMVRRVTSGMLLGAFLSGIAVGAGAATLQQPAAEVQGDAAKRTAPPARKMPEAPSADMPKNSGVVVVPPKTDSAAIATPPANVDPGIHGAEEGVDRKNREKTKEKRK